MKCWALAIIFTLLSLSPTLSSFAQWEKFERFVPRSIRLGLDKLPDEGSMANRLLIDNLHSTEQRPTASFLTDSVFAAWVVRYAGGVTPSSNRATAMAIDSVGNVYVTGWSAGSGTSNDYATVKYNAEGVQQWAARYNGPSNGDDRATGIAVDNSGNVYVTGWSPGSGTSDDYATIKYDSTGVQQWVARYNGPGSDADWAYAITIDAAGNVYVTGGSFDSQTFFDYATVKYSAAGVQQWVARYNGPFINPDEAYAIAVDAAGNVYVTGESWSFSDPDYATVKYNSVGVEQWAARYNGPAGARDAANAIAIDAAGNVYVTGVSRASTFNDYATIKYNSSGVQQWVARYTGSGNGEAAALALDTGGYVYVTGVSAGSGTSNDYATVKYNAQGVQQWVARYNGPGNGDDRATAIALDRASNVYVTGWSTGSGTSYDYTTIKYDTSGVVLWAIRYNGTGNSDDRPVALAVNAAGNVYVTGTESGSGGSVYTTLKYVQVLTSVEEWGGVPASYSLEQNYPNPFNPVTRIRFDLPQEARVEVAVFDLLGRRVSTLVSGTKAAGTHSVVFSASGLTSGVYFYQLQAEPIGGAGTSFREIKKLVLMR